MYGKETLRAGKSIFDNSFMAVHTKLVRKHSYQLTELGKRKAEEMAAEGDKLAILTTLDEEGACSIGEISRSTRIGQSRINAILHEFKSFGWVTSAANTQSNKLQDDEL